MTESDTEQHVLIPLVTFVGDLTEYRCQKCGQTGLGGIRGPCKGVPSSTGMERGEGQ